MLQPDLARAASWGDPPPRPCPTLHRLLRLAGAKPADRVCVAGPQGLAALLSLCHMGFSQACCFRGEACPCGDGPCDVLLLTGPMDRDAFTSTLAHALPRLKDGGVLAAHEAGLEDDALILQALQAAGRTAGWRVHDMAGSCLVALEVARAPAEGRRARAA
jgi:hypothetical protein